MWNTRGIEPRPYIRPLVRHDNLVGSSGNKLVVKVPLVTALNTGYERVALLRDRCIGKYYYRSLHRHTYTRNGRYKAPTHNKSAIESIPAL